ncbi:tRNA splicing endonuclease subunit SEN34 [Aspergillus nidulans FGSC A4]|uniref:tRNA-splicing endonuclease subunit Sen34 n=1 Tax=Emericella nidulans (strain FGSC A4 / ATCC 38163 / CBS 112.46 / NRRL 194 / M139) TaxID=227321 RepID=C8VUX2_EMENI|nr:tRNA splicing endonuclease subunit SEN34 [Aspergillus nidulans FGSC A4]CBF90007.1 TPA: tRNA-splicing endonuclease subunit sen34 (AFU_orthologue; AFUA_5G11140) [Aspergillus nidulans FGSC A4]
MNPSPDLPIPISYIAGNYFVFSVDAATFLRREHHICGVLAGTLPQVPQQNIFTGLPLELMPEEARLLAEKGVACIVDEVNFQKQGMNCLVEEDRKKYLEELELQGVESMQLQVRRKERQREEALKKKNEKAAAKAKKTERKQDTAEPASGEDSIVPFFDDAQPSVSPNHVSSRRPSTLATPDAMGITPAVSHPPLPQQPPAEHLLSLPEVPSSYPLFAHLHSKGYFLSPGLRFGCQYMAYPGDPLRFHSHFLVVSAEWDEQLDLMTIITGGRLGTGVKKGFLIGGADKSRGDPEEAGANVRSFSIEWAGM